jgi:hypothetical protein
MSLLEHIVKTGSGYKLVSKKTGKNLGTAKSKAGIEKRERQVQFFKHQHEEVVTEKNALMKILTPTQKAVKARVDKIMQGKDPDQKKESLGEIKNPTDLHIGRRKEIEPNKVKINKPGHPFHGKTGHAVVKTMSHIGVDHPEHDTLLYYKHNEVEPIKEMAPVDELISFAQYFEMVQFDGDPRMFKDPLTRNPLDRGPVTGTQYSENDTAGNGDAGVVGGLTPPYDSDLPANISQSPGGYSKNINTPGIPMTMGESPIKQFIHGKFQEPKKLSAKYARPKKGR